MSFSYKTLNSNDIALTSYIANKQWEVNNATLLQNGIKIYIGENLPINKTNPFDPVNDSQTENEEYRRLVFDSIKNLYYQNYVSGTLSGNFYQSSSFFNYEQSTLTSGTIRNLPTIAGSINGPSVYDVSSSLYNNIIYDSDKGSKITVISIDQKIFGSGLSPNTVNISGSTYNLQDDGEGNLKDVLTSTYVGNVFYSQGLIVITNQDYLCVFGTPPTTTNNYFSYLNLNYNPQTLDILKNDFADCGAIDQTSIQLMTVPGFSFPNYTLNNGVITITPDQSSIIPGDYQLNYTVGNFNSIRSNTSSINLTVTSQPLQITNLISSSICYASTALAPVTFSINYGVPPYSYSLDNGTTYTGIPGFFNKTASGSVTASLTSSIYVKDYMGTVVTKSFSSKYFPVTYTYDVVSPRCYSSNAGGIIYAYKSGTAISASIGTGSYFSLPAYIDLPSTSSIVNFKDINGCVTSSTFLLPIIPALTSSITIISASCNGSSDGSISASFSNVSSNNPLAVILKTGSVYLTASNGYTLDGNYEILDFPNTSFTVNNLKAGIYTMSLDPGEPEYPISVCQYYGPAYITIAQPAPLTFNVTASYIDSCSNALIFSGSGGTPPYTYYAVRPGKNITYSSNTLPLTLNGLTGNTYNTFIVDSKGCVSTSSLINVFSRAYQYTGSYCVTSSGNNTGFISSSGIQQNFTTGPYSGSIVTSSYSNGTTLYGPTVNYKQLFISGAIEIIMPCGTKFNRYYSDLTVCPPGGCFAPVLVTASPINCTTNWTSSYAVTYNSSSALATKTIIEYSYNSNFSPKVTHSINNASPTMLPFYTWNDFAVFNSPDQIMYFRAYNSCSIGTTSSYSNVLTASCNIPPISSAFTLRIQNHSSGTLLYTTGSTPTQYTIYNNNSVDILIYQDDQIKTVDLYVIRSGNPNLSDGHNVNVSSSNNVNGCVYTTLEGYYYQNQYTVLDEYSNGGYNFYFADDRDNNTPDLYVNVDTNNYNNAGVVVLDITSYNNFT
jgi:hypothetical protein